MGLQWYAVPMVSNLMLDCGGVEYTGVPFNGWFMGTEVGSRDLCDESRYNILQVWALQGATHALTLRCVCPWQDPPPPPWKCDFWAAQAILGNFHFKKKAIIFLSPKIVYTSNFFHFCFFTFLDVTCHLECSKTPKIFFSSCMK